MSEFKIMPVTDLRRETTSVMKSITEHGQIVYITQYGRPAVVMLEYEQYESLIQANKKPISWPEDYFDLTYGALSDDPLSRPEQGDFPERDPLL